MNLGLFEFLIALVILTTISSVMTSRHKLEREKIRSRAAREGDSDEVMQTRLEDLQLEVARLKERIQVLERLATDDDRRLAEEIDRLARRETSASL